MRNLLTVLVLAAFAVPAASAHGAPVVLDVEELVLQDEASDGAYACDGFDITYVYIREAYLMDTEQTGIMVRLMASGGNTVGLASQHELAFGFSSGANHVFALTSSDGLEWTGDVTVREHSNTKGALFEVIPVDVTDVNMQVFVAYDELGIAPGDMLTDFWVTASADGTLVDSAPGPMHYGELAITAFGEGAAGNDVTLGGPAGYTETKLAFTDGVLRADVENTITAAGQHLFLRTSVPAEHVGGMVGDAAFEGSGKSVDAGQDIVFTADVQATDVFMVKIISDLGGKEIFYVSPDGTVSKEPITYVPESDVGVEAPGLPLFALLGAVALLALRRRK